MNEYHKIQSVFKRDQKGKLLQSEFSLPVFEYLRGCHWAMTEKVDGTNIRVMWDGQSVKFGGKTDAASIPAPLVNRLSELFLGQAQTFSQVFTGPACLYGEGYGAKIQKGGGNYKPDGQDFVLFDVRIGRWWLERVDVEDIAIKLGIRVVPILKVGTLDSMVDLVAQGFDSAWGSFCAEGLVARPQTELYDRNGQRVITKLKHRDFA